MTTTDISTFDQRVRFEIPVRTANQSGGGTETWTTLLECWAYIKQTFGERGQEAARTAISRDARLYCRFRMELSDDMTAETRIIALDKLWRIQGYRLIDNKKHIYEFNLSAIE